MLKFIDKSDYNKPTYQQVSPTEISWHYQDEQGRNHSGFFIAGRKSNHLRLVDTGQTEQVEIGVDEETNEPIFEDQPIIESVEFEPFAEVLELGLVSAFDQVAYNANIAEEQREAARSALKSKREADLQSITHDFGDGRIVQVRPQDVGNFQLAISKNSTTEWIMEDNTIAELTVEELQTAFASGVAQGEKIYMDYMQTLKAL